ncbi:MAG: LuxR family transcriptional regulator [Gammaproteobacteria bacterium]|nr:LuxR family transcriptional regulator [Gammaproteobacteria bacterium]
MQLLIAAGSTGLREWLGRCAGHAGAQVARLTSDPGTLPAVMAASGSELILTTGPDTAGFWRAAQAGRLPAVVLSDQMPPVEALASPLGWLRRDADAATLRAALTAVAHGLHVLQGAGLPRAAVPGSAGRRLSPREREVLERVAAGLSTKRIARQLAVSPNTIKFHLQETFAKLGAATRSEAVVAAIRRGELTL